jgi:DNA-binding beta-propeller fold protein YncE
MRNTDQLRGSGPGEYLGPAGIVVSPVDGTIYVRDAALSRMNLYSPTGEYLESWPLRTGAESLHPPVLCTDGRLYTIARLPNRGTSRRRSSTRT